MTTALGDDAHAEGKLDASYTIAAAVRKALGKGWIHQQLSS
jgi:hypothetical protein